MTTKTKPKRKEKPPKPKPGKFEAGDRVEFHFTESSDGVRPQGDAEVLKVDDVTPKQRMYQLKVLKVTHGKPSALKNPSGELWALDGELFAPGTRAKHDEALRETGAGEIAKQVKAEDEKCSAPREKKPALGLPADFRRLKEQTGGALLLFRHGKLYEAFNGDAAVVGKVLRLKLGQREEVAAVAIGIDDLFEAKKKLIAAGHCVGLCEVDPEGGADGGHKCFADDAPKRDEYLEGILANVGDGSACLAKEESIAAACTILFEETKGRCDLVMLAGKFKLSARKQIAAKLLGREAAHDENGISFLREEFRGALEIDRKLTSDEADERIAARAIEIVQAIDAKEAEASGLQATNSQEIISEEPSGEQGAAGAAAEQSQPANESTQEMKTKSKASHPKKQHSKSNGKAHANGKAERGLSLLDAAAKVLERRSNPMTTKELVAEIVERKLWTPGAGKTPDQTLSAAIGTEINKKGKESRFKKDSPGKFLLK